jgi:hypothetical protein
MAGLDPMASEGGNSPIENLREHLKAARLEAITQAAAASGGVDSLSTEAITRIGHLHLALLAVRDEIDVHAPKLGAGSEAPLL